MQISDLRIGTRLGAGIGLAAVLLVAMVWIGVSNMASIQQALEQETSDRLPQILAGKDVKDNLRLRAIVSRNIVLMEDPAEKQKAIERMGSAREAYTKLYKQLQDTVHADAGKAALAKMDAAMAALRPPTDQVAALGLAGKNTEATQMLVTVVTPLQATATEATEAFVNLLIKNGEDAAAASERAYGAARLLLIGLGTAAVALLCALGWLLVRSITGPLNQAVQISRAVADGDLSLDFDASGRSETAQLLASLKAMQASLAQVVGNVRQNAEGVASASAQISDGNNDLSGRTEQQASALEETAASMEELSSTVRQNADNARQANQLAQSASSVAIQGGDVVGRVVQTMKGINDSSKKIADIISVIDGIAFQTNILALNAAVEAARAGEQGRGFAVVASEVRGLAQRSAEAAKEIKALISASVERVDLGTSLVDQAGVTMHEVVTSIRRVTDIMGEISAASSEQSAGVSQIGEAVTQMDQATQQNAALVEESAAAASSLAVQARQLLQTVAVFKLGQGSSVRPVATTPAPTPSKPRPAAVRATPPVSARKPVAMAASAARSTTRPASNPAPKQIARPAPALATVGGGAEGDWESF